MSIRMPALTIKTKLVLAYTLVFGILMSIFAFVVYRSTLDARMAKLDALLEAHAGKLLTEIEEDFNDQEEPEQTGIVQMVPDGLRMVHVQLLLPSGQAVISDSSLRLIKVDTHNSAFRGATLRQTVRLGTDNYRILWQPVEIDEQIPYVLELATPLHELEDDLAQLRLLFMIAIPAILLLTGLAAYGISRAALLPIVRMTETTRQITAHNLESRLDVPRAQDEVRRLGETLNELMERLESAFRSQRQFVADASHEIRTPLAIVRTELENALRETVSPSLRESIQTSLTEVDRLARMSGQLLLLAKLDANPADIGKEAVRLDELLVECVQLSTTLALQKGIRIEVHVEDAIESRADGERLKSVFLNLFDNAIKYSPQNSLVKASVRRDETDGRIAHIIVEDNGPGISPMELPRIFQRFYRSESHRGEGSGSGLGLAIARQIVEMHHGSLTVETEEGSGTIFRICLPIGAAM